MNTTTSPNALPPGFWSNTTISATRAKAIIRAHRGLHALKGSNAIAAHEHTRARRVLDELHGLTVSWLAVLDPAKNTSFVGTAHHTIHEILQTALQAGEVAIPLSEETLEPVSAVLNPPPAQADVVAQSEHQRDRNRSESPLTNPSSDASNHGNFDKENTAQTMERDTAESPHSNHMDMDIASTHTTDPEAEPEGVDLPSEESDDEIHDKCCSVRVIASFVNTGTEHEHVHVMTTGTFLLTKSGREHPYTASTGDLVDHLLTSNILDPEHYPFKLFYVEDNGKEKLWLFLASVPTMNFENAVFPKPPALVPVTYQGDHMEIRVTLRHVRHHSTFPPAATPAVDPIPAAAPHQSEDKPIHPKGKPQKGKPVKNTFSPQEKQQSHVNWLEAAYGNMNIVGSVKHGDGLLWDEWVELSTIVAEAEREWEKDGRSRLTFYDPALGDRVDNKAYGVPLRGPALMAWLNKGDTWIGQLRRGYKLIQELSEDEITDAKDVNQSYDHNGLPQRTGALTWLQGLEQFSKTRSASNE